MNAIKIKNKLLHIIAVVALVAIALTLALLILNACKNATLSQALTAYEENDYHRVAVLLEPVNKLDDNAQKILIFSHAQIAFAEEKDYQKVVDLLLPEDNLDDNLREILLISQAHIAFFNQDYPNVINTLQDLELTRKEDSDILIASKGMVFFQNESFWEAVEQFLMLEDGRDFAQYTEACEKIVAKAFETRSVSDVVSIYNLEAQTGEQIIELTTGMCESTEYADFLFVDDLISKLPENELKESIAATIDAHGIERAKAFLCGDWEWENNDGTRTTVRAYIAANRLFADLLIIGDTENNYKHQAGDLYWSEFEFQDENHFTCLNLTRNVNGRVVLANASGEIDYENASIQMHLTAPPPYRMVNADRKWNKLS